MNNKIDQLLYKESLKAYKKNEIPVGAIIVKNNKIIAKSHNNRQKKYDILGHAEINCIKKASKKIKDWRLDNCELYVTLMPCEMCQMIIKKSRISKIHYILDNKNENKIINNLIQTNDCFLNKNNYEKLFKNFFERMRK